MGTQERFGRRRRRGQTGAPTLIVLSAESNRWPWVGEKSQGLVPATDDTAGPRPLLGARYWARGWGSPTRCSFEASCGPPKQRGAGVPRSTELCVFLDPSNLGYFGLSGPGCGLLFSREYQVLKRCAWRLSLAPGNVLPKAPGRGCSGTTSSWEAPFPKASTSACVEE